MVRPMRDSRLLLVLAALSATALAGCVGSPPPPNAAAPSLSLQPGSEDSTVVGTVTAATGGLTYGDLLLAVNGRVFQPAAAADFGQGLYEVEGKRAGDAVMPGDALRVPAGAGKAALEVRLASSGLVLDRFEVPVEDHTAPQAVANLRPAQGLTDAPRTPEFAWTAGQDPSGIAYTLEYWVVLPSGTDGPGKAVPGLTASTYTLADTDALLPAQTYRWHVRVLDGAGNPGAWSATWQFQTGV
jgi:hypothetical protein